MRCLWFIGDTSRVEHGAERALQDSYTSVRLGGHVIANLHATSSHRIGDCQAASQQTS